ncbi:MAG: AAA family ATPase, partial [Dehalococcoidia bacterium]|nr:AAA family ATPase [Dehalococcoidia bacterium]
MLERVHIKNFAVARDVAVEPGPGLNVFTGETGAGKSIVVDALAFAFGARRGRESVATGAERAVVEVAFTADGERHTIERAITASGRSTARLDGAPSTIETLQRLGDTAIEVHGQSDQLAVLRPAVQRTMLDDYAGLASERAELAARVRELREVRRSIASLATDARERERRIDQLRFEVQEIEEAALTPGEDEALRQEHARLAGATRTELKTRHI